MFEIGRLVIKNKGKEKGKYAVVVGKKDNFVVIDGNVKRRKCNPNHLEPQPQKFEIKEGAPTQEVKKILEENNLLEKKEVSVKNKRERKGKPKPKKKSKKRKKKVKSSEKEVVEDALKAAGK